MQKSQTTRECTVPSLNSAIRGIFENWIHNDDVVQYCVEGLTTGTSYDGSEYTIRTAIVLTQSNMLYVLLMSDGGGTSCNRRYSEVERIEDRTSRPHGYHYVEIFLNTAKAGLPESVRFDFETREKAHAFVDLFRKLARI